MISEKKDLFAGSSGSSNTAQCLRAEQVERCGLAWSVLWWNAVQTTPHTFGMLVAECPLPHVTQPHHPLACAVQEITAVSGVELSGSDDLGEVLHVGGLDVNDVCRQSRHGVRTAWKGHARSHFSGTTASPYSNPQTHTHTQAPQV